MTATTESTYRSTLNDDGTVTVWDVYRQQWVTTDRPSDQILASLGGEERERVMQHLGMA